MVVDLILLAAIAALVVHLELKDRRHGRAVESLLQRIQDPVAAVATHVVREVPQPVAHLPFDDDAAWRTHAEELELSGVVH